MTQYNDRELIRFFQRKDAERCKDAETLRLILHRNPFRNLKILKNLCVSRFSRAPPALKNYFAAEPEARLSDFRYSRKSLPRSSRFKANSTVAIKNPSLSPASCRTPSSLTA